MHNIHYWVEPENADRKSVIDRIMKFAERDGDGHSGRLRWHDEISPLEDQEAAEAKIKALDNGWYDDHAVRFYDHSDAKPTKKMGEIAQRRAETKEKMKQYAAAHSVRNFKADLVGCPNCGSKLARKRLTSERCPVCYTDLRSETTLKKLEEYGQKIERLDDQIEQEKKKQKAARKVMWLVKFEYHS